MPLSNVFKLTLVAESQRRTTTMQYGCGFVCGTGELLLSPLKRSVEGKAKDVKERPNRDRYLPAQLRPYGQHCRAGDMVQVRTARLFGNGLTLRW